MRAPVLFVILLGIACHQGVMGAPRRPNVVVILADDLGYGDVSCYNPSRGRIKTAHIDRLAEQGMRFTDGHSSSGCCSPSRYTLLTGRYHWRTRLQQGIVGQWEKPLIAPDRLTIASLAQKQGYRTGCFGKWHLGWDWPIAPEQMPHVRGLGGKSGGGGEVPSAVATDEQRSAWRTIFEKPILGGPTTRGFDEYFGTDVPNWPPYCFLENDRTLGIPSELLSVDQLARFQASFQGPAVKDWKLVDVLRATCERAASFIKRQAAEKQPFLVYLPLTAPHTPIAPEPAWRGKSGLGDYGDFVLQTDDCVGTVLQAIDAAGITDNTLVLFSSDNGCAPFLPAGLEAQGHYPSGPLREYKTSVYEGGHREPFIVRWPGVVQPGATSHQYVQQADLLATLADLWEVKLPDTAGEDSFSLLPLLQGSDQPVRPHGVNTACAGTPSFRQGAWKIVLQNDAMARTDVELYNLDSDLGESKNIAADHPQRVAAMRQLLERVIADGRSTPGAVQKNDVAVRRYPQPAASVKGKAKSKAQAKAKQP